MADARLFKPAPEGQIAAARPQEAQPASAAPASPSPTAARVETASAPSRGARIRSAGIAESRRANSKRAALTCHARPHQIPPRELKQPPPDYHKKLR